MNFKERMRQIREAKATYDRLKQGKPYIHLARITMQGKTAIFACGCEVKPIPDSTEFDIVPCGTMEHLRIKWDYEAFIAHIANPKPKVLVE